jgi:hypothetical protein
MKHKWHKVEDKLPEIGQIVLSWNEIYPDDITQAYYGGEDKWQELDECGDYLDWRPLYWMELPDPPKEPIAYMYERPDGSAKLFFDRQPFNKEETQIKEIPLYKGEDDET